MDALLALLPGAKHRQNLSGDEVRGRWLLFEL